MSDQFPHKQSAHCENGVISGLLRYQGSAVSEPMVFGIGSGLLFCHIPFLMVDQAPAFTYRSMPGQIFRSFTKRVGIKMEQRKFKDHKEAQRALDANLDQGRPVGLQVGVYNLPYFPPEYRFHFNAHNLIVYGKRGDRYLISDPVMEVVTELSEAELEKVRFAKGAFAPKGQMYFPVSVPEEVDWRSAIRKGVSRTAQTMLAPVPIVGYRGIHYTANLIRKWPAKVGNKKANHYLGQIVRMQEEIGTGGGGFRYIFAAFLQEASKLAEHPEWMPMSHRMTAIGDQWRDFALAASRIYRDRNAPVGSYNEVAAMLDELAEQEKQFFQDLKKTV